MKTIRLLYPDYLGGGLDTYYFGSNLLAHILPENDRQPLIRVNIPAPCGREYSVTEGIYAKSEVLAGIHDAQSKIESENPERIITIGSNCLVSLAPFDYMHGKFKHAGIIWIDAHPDVSTVNDGYPNAHAMVLGSLLGRGGDESLSAMMKNDSFGADEVLYVGLQGLHSYQSEFLRNAGVNFRVQDESFVADDEILGFMGKFEAVFVHLDIDVMSEKFFHSTYFANPELSGDGSGGGKMTMPELSRILHLITANSDVRAFTVAEYLPFDEHNLHKMFSGINIFTE